MKIVEQISWGQVTVTALLSFLVSVGVFHYTNSKPDLVYRKSPAAHFDDGENSLSIYTATVENVGTREAESVQVLFEMTKGGVISDIRVEPYFLNPSMSVHSDAIREIRLQTINPGEVSKFSILGREAKSSELIVEVRALGIVGRDGPSGDSVDIVLKVIFGISALIAVLGLFMTLVRSSDRKFGKIIDSQRRMLELEMRKERAESIAKNETDISGLVLNVPLRLYYNPNVSPPRSKPLLLVENGVVAKGENQNEHKWRISNGLLELIDNKGKVHSRFYYSPVSRTFYHTNDPDTGSILKHGIHDQFIVFEKDV